MAGQPGRAGWAADIARAEATAWLWRQCVAPSPRQAARLAETEAAVARMRAHWRRMKAGAQPAHKRHGGG